MKLKKNEQSIFAYFPSEPKARKAITALREANLISPQGSVQIDKISRYAAINDTQYDNPFNDAATLHGLTHYAHSSGLDGANSLLAANDSESGAGVFDDSFAGKSFMVTLVTNRENAAKIMQILKENNATV